jgi:hypothetical protein
MVKYLEVRLSIGIFGVVISGNARIVYQQLDSPYLHVCNSVDKPMDIFFLADICWYTN